MQRTTSSRQDGFDPGRSVVVRATGRARYAAALPWSKARIALGTRRIRQRAAALPPDPQVDVERDLVVLVSERVANDDRLDILQAMVGRLTVDLGDRPPAVVLGESSPSSHLDAAMAVWEASGLPMRASHREEPIVSAYLRVLEHVGEPYALLQLDDQLAGGLSPSFLAGAIGLLRQFEGLVDIVSVRWPLDIVIDDEAQELVLHVAEHRDGRYRFRDTGFLEPVAVVTVHGRRFGIFENFDYGFFMNHSVMPTQDFRRRLAWYADRLATTDAHHIENMAAGKRRGPFWTHAALCLDAAAIVDLDYAHSATSDRPAAPELRRITEAVAAGYAIRPIVVEAGRG